MLPAIRAIPTFGIITSVTTVGQGINQLIPDILASRTTWMIWTSGTTPWRSGLVEL